MTFKNEINEVGEEINLYETETDLANNVLPKPEKISEPSRRNTHFLRLMYVPSRRTINFFFGFIPRKTMIYKEIGLNPIS